MRGSKKILFQKSAEVEIIVKSVFSIFRTNQVFRGSAGRQREQKPNKSFRLVLKYLTIKKRKPKLVTLGNISAFTFVKCQR